jgi:F0F1-type ATP synthase assembly protein I
MNGLLLALRLTGLGWYIAICIVAGVAGGVGLDKLTGTAPLFMLVGTVLGSIVAFWGVYKLVLPVVYGMKHRDSTTKGGKH